MRHFVSVWLSFFIALIWLQPVLGQNDGLMENIREAEESDHGQIGISVRQLDGQLMFAYQGDTKLIPASTLKMITTLSAIEILGQSFEYQTRIGYTGELLEDGTLQGDIVIVGSGDPSLASPEYPGIQSWQELLLVIVAGIRDAGIRCIDGSIIVNDGLFDRQVVHPSWAWDDLTNYYASGAGGFNWHENLYYLPFNRSTGADVETQIDTITPSIPGLIIENFVRTGPKNSGDNAYIFGDPYRLERQVRGTVPPGTGTFTIKGAIPQPAAAFAHHVVGTLIQSGISVQGHLVQNEESQNEIKHLLVLNSPTLRDLVDYANTKSNNLYCEAFFKTMGAKIGVGNFENGEKTIMEHLRLLGIPSSGWNQKDGSGLSARNRVTPNFMTAFLSKKADRLGVETLQELLPKVGEEGTVRSLLNGYTAQKNTWLKSGSINQVLAYAGVLQTKSGTDLTIAIMANGHSGNRKMRQQMEKIIQVMYEDL